MYTRLSGRLQLRKYWYAGGANQQCWQVCCSGTGGENDYWTLTAGRCRKFVLCSWEEAAPYVVKWLVVGVIPAIYHEEGLRYHALCCLQLMWKKSRNWGRFQQRNVPFWTNLVFHTFKSVPSNMIIMLCFIIYKSTMCNVMITIILITQN